jgi:hypothetical protein
MIALQSPLSLAIEPQDVCGTGTFHLHLHAKSSQLSRECRHRQRKKWPRFRSQKSCAS